MILFISEPGRNWGVLSWIYGCVLRFTIYSVFVFVIMAVNSNGSQAAGFRWLFAGFSLFLVGCVVSALSDFYFENDGCPPSW